MKKLRNFFLVSFTVMASFTSIYAMEPFVEEHEFLKLSIFDIQNEAKDLTQDTDIKYKIVTQPMMLEECLKALGLNGSSTPLDIRYHYELIEQKLLHNDGLHNIVTKAYNQLIVMLSEIKEYRQEVKYLLKMPFEELQTMELEDKENFTHNFFLDSKNVAIDKVIESLKKQHRQHIKSKHISNQLPIILQEALNLPADASFYMVDKHYKNYMQGYQDYSNRLIAHATMKNISTQMLKKKLDEVEKVRQAYEQYVQKRGQQ